MAGLLQLVKLSGAVIRSGGRMALFICPFFLPRTAQCTYISNT